MSRLESNAGKASFGNGGDRLAARRLRLAMTTLLRSVTTTERADLLGVLAQRLAIDPSTLTGKIQRIDTFMGSGRPH